MKIYKFEKLEFCGNQHNYETRATHTQYYTENTVGNRRKFAEFSGMNPSNQNDRLFVLQGVFDSYSSSITEIEVIE